MNSKLYVFLINSVQNLTQKEKLNRSQYKNINQAKIYPMVNTLI